jgi:subtilisin-like proprotein convertase family protein
MNYCFGTIDVSTETGVISDGSGELNYTENSDCKWLIQGMEGKSIVLTFTSFTTEQTYDGVEVFDGFEFNAPSLGFFSGNSLPPQMNGTSGRSMYIHFTSDDSINEAGWSLSFARVESATPSSGVTSGSVGTSHTSHTETSTSVTTGPRVTPNDCRTYIATGLPLPIPPSETETQTNSIINVQDSFPLYEVQVFNVKGNHSYIGDLMFYLEGPDGTRVLLSGRTCGASEGFEISWSDSASSENWFCPPSGGIYKPAASLSAFYGKSSMGQWKLIVDDSITDDSGTLTGWQLQLCTVSDRSENSDQVHSNADQLYPGIFILQRMIFG